MNVSAIVAGYEATWRFRHSRRLDAWLAGQPWRGSGGVLAVRVASTAQASATIAALGRAARAADEHGDVRVLTVRSEDLALGILMSIARALELPEVLGPREASRRIGEELHHPHLFIAEPSKGPEVSRVFDDAAGFCNDISRISPATAATIILLELPAHPVSGDFVDLSVGGPADGLLDLLDGPEAELWRAYVHARLAWEAAGDLSRIEMAEAQKFAELRVGDDNGFEQRLNIFAEVYLASLPDRVNDISERFLATAVQTSCDSSPPPPRGELEMSGLFWRPTGESLPRPSPWWARAILLRNRAGTLRYQFRSCLVCAPIAREILVRCFNLEALDRASRLPKQRAQTDSESTWRFESFRLAHPESESLHYPKLCPAVPRDATDFASYGAILSSLPTIPARDTAGHRLRRLRNTVAHGHYISWTTLKEVQQVGAILS